MRIKKFKDFKINFNDINIKDELDKLDYKSIQEARSCLIQEQKEDWRRKAEELDFYLKKRFKDISFTFYDRVIRRSKIKNTVKAFDDSDMFQDKEDGNLFSYTEIESYKLIAEFINEMGYQKFYDMSLDIDLKKIGPSKYRLY